MFCHCVTVCMYVLPLFNIFECKFWILIAFRPSLLHYVGSVCSGSVASVLWLDCVGSPDSFGPGNLEIDFPLHIGGRPFFVSPEPCVCCVHTQCLRNVEKGVLAGTWNKMGRWRFALWCARSGWLQAWIMLTRFWLGKRKDFDVKTTSLFMSTPFCALVGGLRWILLFWTCVSWFWWCARTRPWKADCFGWVWVQGATHLGCWYETCARHHVQPRSCFHRSTDLLFCRSHCLTLVQSCIIWSIFPYDLRLVLSPFCIWTWEMQSGIWTFLVVLTHAIFGPWWWNRYTSTAVLWSGTCQSLHGLLVDESFCTLCVDVAKTRGSQQPSVSVFWGCFSTFPVLEVRAKELVAWKSWIIMPISGKTAGILRVSYCRWFWELRSWILGSFLKRYQCKAQRQHWCWESNWREQWVFQI